MHSLTIAAIYLSLMGCASVATINVLNANAVRVRPSVNPTHGTAGDWPSPVARHHFVESAK